MATKPTDTLIAAIKEEIASGLRSGTAESFTDCISNTTKQQIQTLNLKQTINCIQTLIPEMDPKNETAFTAYGTVQTLINEGILHTVNAHSPIEAAFPSLERLNQVAQIIRDIFRVIPLFDDQNLYFSKVISTLTDKTEAKRKWDNAVTYKQEAQGFLDSRITQFTENSFFKESVQNIFAVLRIKNPDQPLETYFHNGAADYVAPLVDEKMHHSLSELALPEALSFLYLNEQTVGQDVAAVVKPILFATVKYLALRKTNERDIAHAMAMLQDTDTFANPSTNSSNNGTGPHKWYDADAQKLHAFLQTHAQLLKHQNAEHDDR